MQGSGQFDHRLLLSAQFLAKVRLLAVDHGDAGACGGDASLSLLHSGGKRGSFARGTLRGTFGSLGFFLEPLAARLGILAFGQRLGESRAHGFRALAYRPALRNGRGGAEGDGA